MSLREYQRHCQGHLPGVFRLWVEDLEREKGELEARVEQLKDALKHYAAENERLRGAITSYVDLSWLDDEDD